MPKLITVCCFNSIRKAEAIRRPEAVHLDHRQPLARHLPLEEPPLRPLVAQAAEVRLGKALGLDQATDPWLEARADSGQARLLGPGLGSAQEARPQCPLETHSSQRRHSVAQTRLDQHRQPSEAVRQRLLLVVIMVVQASPARLSVVQHQGLLLVVLRACHSQRLLLQATSQRRQLQASSPMSSPAK